MNEQQFRVNDLVKFNYSEITEYVDEEHTPTPLRNDEVCDLLNELSEENEKLKKYCTVLKNQIKTMGEIGGFNKHMIKTIWESNYDD